MAHMVDGEDSCTTSDTQYNVVTKVEGMEGFVGFLLSMILRAHGLLP